MKITMTTEDNVESIKDNNNITKTENTGKHQATYISLLSKMPENTSNVSFPNMDYNLKSTSLYVLYKPRVL